jgi:P27 family predicted phage terminase small subunit
MGILSAADENLAVRYCQTWTRRCDYQRKLDARGIVGHLVRCPSGAVQVNPVVYLLRAADADCLRMERELGLTPAARASLRVDTADAQETTKPEAGKRRFLR